MQKTEQICENLYERYPILRMIEKPFAEAFAAIVKSYRQGGKLLVCGNGGSAADADHIVGELMKGFLLRRPLSGSDAAAFEAVEGGAYLCEHLQGALPAISLCAHSALSTAFSNDVAPDMVFAQQVYGYGRSGDVLLAMSTSGNSANVCNAVKTARVRGVVSVGITGEQGGALAQLCDVCLCLPEKETFAVQELTLPVYHALCAMLEEMFFPSQQ